MLAWTSFQPENIFQNNFHLHYSTDIESDLRVDIDLSMKDSV